MASSHSTPAGVGRTLSSLLWGAFLLVVALSSAAAFAQEQLQFNVPYRCTDGTYKVISQCKPYGRGEMCYWGNYQKNGQLINEQFNVRPQMDGWLRECRPENPSSPPATGSSTAAAARQSSTPAPSTLVATPAGRIAAGLNPPYLNNLPSVDTVKRLIQGSDPTDTLIRQVAVLNRLSARIQHHLANNQHASRLSPDEMNVKYAYDLASYQIEQEYKKTHTPAEANAFVTRHNQLESDWAIEKEIDTKLLSADAVAENRANDAGAFQQLKAHNDAIVRQNEEAKARGEAAEKAQAQGMRAPLNDPGAVEARRCLELGGSDLECLGKAMKTGMFDLIGFNPEDLTGPSRAGLVLTGNYDGGTNSVSAGFTDSGMNISGCGKLVNVNPAYTLAKRGNQMLIHVANSPQPFTAVLGPDGGIVGPGMTVVDGQVITGYRHYTVVDHRASDWQVVGQHEVSEPIYGPATQRCNIGVMRPIVPRKADENAGNANALVGMVAGLSKAMGIETSTVGLRMIGQFSGAGGLKVQFGHDKAVLDCGEAHIIAEYAVANTPSQLEVTVNNSGSPVRLALQEDGSLAGSGTVNVSGRVMVGENQNREIVYRPATTHCAVGTLAAGGKVVNAAGNPSAAKVAVSAAVAPTAATDSTHSSTAMPSDAAGNIILSVQVGMPAGNAFVGHSLMLMKDRFDNIMRKLGAPLPAGASALDAWKVFITACRPPADCKPLKAALAQYVASGANVDASGKATFAGLSPATYYVTGNSMFNNQPTFWNVAVEVKPGQTSLLLDQNNGVPLK